MIKIGITGGIGSGKSIVCEVFGLLGVSVYHADSRAKILMNEDDIIKNQLIAKFGQNLYKNDQLDRTMLAGIIFEDKSAVEFVNSLVHPAVGNDFDKWCLKHGDELYVIEEAALHFESDAYKRMDIMITIFAPEDMRIKRVVMRNGVTPAQVRSRMNNQLSDEEKVKRSDYVIYNDDKNSVLEQVLKIHHKISSK